MSTNAAEEIVVETNEEQINVLAAKVDSHENRLFKAERGLADTSNRMLSLYDQMRVVELTTKNVDEKMATSLGYSVEARTIANDLKDSVSKIFDKIDNLPAHIIAAIDKHEKDCPAHENTQRKFQKFMDGDLVAPANGRRRVGKNFLIITTGIGAIAGTALWVFIKLTN